MLYTDTCKWNLEKWYRWTRLQSRNRDADVENRRVDIGRERRVRQIGRVALIYREGTGTPLQYSCLENPMDGGAWWAAVHGVAMSPTRLSNFTFTFHFPALEKEMATHSSVLAWRIPGMGEPGGLQSMGSHRVRHDWSDLAAAAAALIYIRCVHAASLQLRLTLCNPVDSCLLGSSVHEFFRQEYWSGSPFPPPGYLPNPGSEAASLMSLALTGGFFTTSTTWVVSCITVPYVK